MAGVVKNALDWLVGSGELYRKPVAVISAGTSGGTHARQMLVQTLTWQGAYVMAELGIPAPRTKSDEAGRLTDRDTVAAITSLTGDVLAAPVMAPQQLFALARGLVRSMHVDVAHVAPPAAGGAGVER